MSACYRCVMRPVWTCPRDFSQAHIHLRVESRDYFGHLALEVDSGIGGCVQADLNKCKISDWQRRLEDVHIGSESCHRVQAPDKNKKKKLKYNDNSSKRIKTYIVKFIVIFYSLFRKICPSV